MSKTATSLSPYHQRLQLVIQTVQHHTKLDDKAASALAKHVLQSLDHIPERIR